MMLHSVEWQIHRLSPALGDATVQRVCFLLESAEVSKGEKQRSRTHREMLLLWRFILALAQIHDREGVAE